MMKMQNLDTIQEPNGSDAAGDILDKNRSYSSDEVEILIQERMAGLNSKHDDQVNKLQGQLMNGRRKRAEEELKTMGLSPELSALMDFSSDESYLVAMEIIQKSFPNAKRASGQKKNSPMSEAIRKIMGLPV